MGRSFVAHALTPQSAVDRRFGEIPPDRPRLGSLEHPNLDRPGAQQHPALAARRVTRSQTQRRSRERSSA
jgi:hypothetical protein